MKRVAIFLSVLMASVVLASPVADGYMFIGLRTTASSATKLALKKLFKRQFKVKSLDLDSGAVTCDAKEVFYYYGKERLAANPTKVFWVAAIHVGQTHEDIPLKLVRDKLFDAVGAESNLLTFVKMPTTNHITNIDWRAELKVEDAD